MTDFTPRYLKNYQSPEFTIDTVNLTITLDDNHTQVLNSMVVNNVSGNNTLTLDGEHLTLVNLTIDNIVLSEQDYQVFDDKIIINVPKNVFKLSIKTQTSPLDNTALEGLYKSGDAYCTQCEAEGFRRITYYLDRPDVLAVFTTKIIADKALYPFLLSNGNKVANEDLANGFHSVTWHDPHPKPCYLFALVAGDFDLLSDSFITSSGKQVALEIFVDKGNKNKAKHAMQSLKHSMKWDEDTFGLEYDLDIYMIVAVDFFNMGAMENKGLNVFNSKFVLADEHSATDTDYFNIEAVIAHEYFHNWTGNRVTCRDWFQLSLKEGLTVFRDQQFSADLNSAAVTRIQNVRVLRSHQFAEDASPMAHPIRPEQVIEMNNFYTLTVYEKGAEVIRMLHTLLGKEKFRQGTDLYFKRFDGMAVTCDDFVNAMADASGVDLTQFKSWYSQAGTPLLQVSESFDEKTNTYQVTIAQVHKPTANQTDKVALHIPVKVELLSQHNDKSIEITEQLLELTSDKQTFTFTEFSSKPTLAFLADLSAPVKVEFEQTDNELEYIMAQANDEVCRWDAGQKLFTRYIKRLIDTPELALPNSLISVFSSMLKSDIDPALIAEQLTLPSFDEIADNLTQVDPDKLMHAIELLKTFLAVGLQDVFIQVYQQTSAQLTTLGKQDKKAVAFRALNNTCLSYIAILPNTLTMVETHYYNADNMTDALAALTACAKNNMTSFDKQLSHFETKWYDTSLVMDKWFSINAMQNNEAVFERLNSLLSHALFSLKNPNRARSLISAFMMTNPKYFHCKSGKGYLFLADHIDQLNTINPQVASRLVTPLLAYKRYEPVRQALIEAQLRRLSAISDLSRDLKEKIDAALNT